MSGSWETHSPATRTRRGVCVVAWCALILPFTTRAQDVLVPVDVHLPICVQALNFDRKLPKRVGDEIVFGILFQRRFRSSNNLHDEALRVLDGLAVDEIDGIPIRYVSLPVSDEDDVERAVLDGEVDVLYVAPLRAISADAITRICRANDVMTCTGVAEYAYAGLTLMVSARRGNPEIVIDFTAMREEGVDFTAQLLGYARVLNAPDQPPNAAEEKDRGP